MWKYKTRIRMCAAVTALTFAVGINGKAAETQAAEQAAIADCLPDSGVISGVARAAFTIQKPAVIRSQAAAQMQAAIATKQEEAREEKARKEQEAARLAQENASEKQQAAAAEGSAQETGAGAGTASGSGDRELLASIIFCEAGNQSFTGQVAVGAVVMNRLASSAYPDSLEAVIYQPGQFTPAGTGWLDQVRSAGSYTASALQAADAALAGENPVGSCLYFDQGGYGLQIGAHYFH